MRTGDEHRHTHTHTQKQLNNEKMFVHIKEMKSIYLGGFNYLLFSPPISGRFTFYLIFFWWVETTFYACSLFEGFGDGRYSRSGRGKCAWNMWSMEFQRRAPALTKTLFKIFNFNIWMVSSFDHPWKYFFGTKTRARSRRNFDIWVWLKMFDMLNILRFNTWIIWAKTWSHQRPNRNHHDSHL